MSCLPLLSDQYWPTPFGIFFIVGPEFRGYHIRFRDFARGGVRLIKSPNAMVNATCSNNFSSILLHCCCVVVVVVVVVVLLFCCLLCLFYSMKAFVQNASTLFDENYNLAFTQENKNKDIAEGGAKGKKQQFIIAIQGNLPMFILIVAGVMSYMNNITFT